MATKRNPGRFTIQFNMNDPMQMAASNILDRQGRRKAQYITNAISFYQYYRNIGNQSPAYTAVPLTKEIANHDTSPDDKSFFTELKKKIIGQPDSPTNRSDEEKKEDLDALFEGAELPAIAETLADFAKM